MKNQKTKLETILSQKDKYTLLTKRHSAKQKVADAYFARHDYDSYLKIMKQILREIDLV